jgi:lysophospholipase L1-like esterase
MTTDSQLSIAWKGRLLLLMVGFVFALITVELAFRLTYHAHPLDLGGIGEWNPMDDSQFTPKLNELRFREVPVDSMVLEEEYTRILFLGDSFTFGQGVPAGEDRFSDLLERELNNRFDQHFHIYNASRPGTEPVNWLKFYKLVAPTYQPDHVFAIFFLRDGTNLCTSFRCYEDVLVGIKAKYTDRFLYRYSFIARFFSDQAIMEEFSDFYGGQIREAYLGDNAQTKTWRLQQDALLQIQELCLANGSSFHLIIFPLLYELDENYPFYDVEEEIVRFAEEASIPVYSLTPGFIGENAEDLWISANDQHPNELGHQLAADSFLPYILKVISK